MIIYNSDWNFFYENRVDFLFLEKIKNENLYDDYISFLRDLENYNKGNNIMPKPSEALLKFKEKYLG